MVSRVSLPKIVTTILIPYQAAREPLGSVSGNTAKASKKRKSEDVSPADVDLDDVDIDGMLVEDNCDQVRRKLQNFLDSGAMTKGRLAEACGTSTASLSRFMGQHGKFKGDGCDAYHGAWGFFKKREILGLEMPKKKQKTSATGSSAKGNAQDSSSHADISEVHLDGEESDAVPVFDTCDEVRRKMTLHFKKEGVTQAQFCRDINAQLHSADKPKGTTRQLTTFRSNKGANSGAKSPIFYAAYVFEKIRVKEGKPKGQRRKEMEDAWGGKGMNLNIDHNSRYV